MPKLKTNRSASKRFAFSSTGKVKSSQANKRHNMRKRSSRQIRDQRGTVVLGAVESSRVKSYLPYGG